MKHQYLSLAKYSSERIELLDVDERWAFDDSFFVNFGGKDGDLLYFNGIIAKTHLYMNYFTSSTSEIEKFRMGYASCLKRTYFCFGFF